MILRFDRTSFTVAVFLLFVLVLLATFGAQLGWIRSWAGDVLATIWLYFVFKSVIEARPAYLVFLAFGFGVAIELAQYLTVYFNIAISNRLLRIVFGATPDWWDVLAYAVGASIAWIAEILFRTENPDKNISRLHGTVDQS